MHRKGFWVPWTTDKSFADETAARTYARSLHRQTRRRTRVVDDTEAILLDLKLPQERTRRATA